MRAIFIAILTLVLPLAATAEPENAEDFVYVTMETSDGVFVLELDAGNAPVSTANFVEYVQDGHYDGTIFHRVIPGFVIQGGGFDVEFNEKETREPIVNEANNGLSNLRGTIAMARTEDPDSATAQFYINLVDNVRLDPQETRAGYTVFGKVIDGMPVVDSIAAIPTGPGGPFDEDVPFRPAIVQKAQLGKPGDPAEERHAPGQ